MKNFWEKLKKPVLPDSPRFGEAGGSRGRPIFCLAPMADVTDCAFRQIIAKYGKPDVFFTEFVSADGLCSVGKEKLLIDLKYSENERPIVAQIFGSKPENFEKAAAMLAKLGFDGIDINMGCPVKKVLNQNSCSALIRTPELAKEIILATMRGAGDIPVSVKTRIGFSKIEIETWIPHILETKPKALTVHLRTVKEMSKVPAHWELMKRIVEIRNDVRVKHPMFDTLIIGNGDVVDIDDARRKCKETGCDGVMLGRAIFGNPWLFTLASKEYISKSNLSGTAVPANFSARQPAKGFYKHIPSTLEKLKVMLEHTKLFKKMLGEHKNFAIMKKHYKAYVNGFNGAKELRVKLMESENATQVEDIVNEFLKTAEKDVLC